MIVSPGLVCARRCGQAKCGKPAVKNMSGTGWCAKHYRLSQMRRSAKYRGKAVPSCEFLESLLKELVLFHCPSCKCKMNWLGKDGMKTAISLQHDASGEIKLICLLCNNRHGQYPGDSFYSIPDGFKPCPGCKAVLPFSEFGSRKHRWNNTSTYCKGCYNARSRRRYAAIKSAKATQ